MTNVHGLVPPRLATPETYVGLARAQGYVVPPVPGQHTYAAPGDLRTNQFALGGTWTETGEEGTSGPGASIDLSFVARRVYVVLGTSDGRARQVRVLLNGKPHGTIVVNGQRLYDVVDLGSPGAGRLSLRFDPGVTAYSFTFG
jgi:thioredoxin family protein